MDIRSVSKRRFSHTIIWALLISCLVVAVTASLGRAALDLKGALSDQPDLAIYLLLPEEEITQTTLLRTKLGERHYLAESKDGPLYVKLRKGEKEWYVVETERLHAQ